MKIKNILNTSFTLLCMATSLWANPPSSPEHPFLDKELPLRWGVMTADKAVPDVEYIIEQSQKKIDAIAQLPDDALTFDNTFLALDQISASSNEAMQKLANLASLNESKEYREALDASQHLLTTFDTNVLLNAQLFDKLKKYSESPNAQTLTPVQKRFIQLTIESFENNGALLDPAGKERLKTINQSLSQLTLKFTHNVLDAKKAWELVIDNESELKGLPETAKEAAKESALQKGYGTVEHPKWRLTLDEVSYLVSVTYIDNAQIRKTMWEGMINRGLQEPHNNLPIIFDILKYRKEKAELLGKKNFADLVLEDRMAKTGDNAFQFVQKLHSLIKPQFDKDINTLIAYKAELDHSKPSMFFPWDPSYLIQKKKKADFNFDQEAFRPYLPIDSVINGLFQVTQKLYNIRFVERPTYVGNTPPSSPDAVQVWSADVKYYDIYNANNEHIASFYTDWSTREGKRSGAWMRPIAIGDVLPNGKHAPHIGVIAANLPKSVNGQPALLSIEETTTIFHEFGHLMHYCLSTVSIKSLHGTNVAWDFVEFPSQFMENLVYEQDILNTFAKDYKTGAGIPKEMFSKLLEYRSSFICMWVMRQLYFAMMDLALHTQFNGNSPSDILPFLEQKLTDYQPPFTVATHPPVGAFLHIFSSPEGYAAAYYSYQWANVLDADVFQRFLERGGINSTFGQEFMQGILNQGNSEPADELYRKLMGRDPEMQPLLNRYKTK